VLVVADVVVPPQYRPLLSERPSRFHGSVRERAVLVCRHGCNLIVSRDIAPDRWLLTVSDSRARPLLCEAYSIW
jgi:hypothetical protein